MSFPVIATAALLLALAGCVAPKAPPAQPPVAAPPRPAPKPVATSTDWRDWPLTPGDWVYRRGSADSTADFGNVLALTCSFAQRRVTLTVAQREAVAAPGLTIRTTSVVRTLPTGLTADGKPFAVLGANDPLLDALGFSRGRFVVEQPGRPPLVIPHGPKSCA